MPVETDLKRIFETYQFPNMEASKFLDFGYLDIVKNSELRDNTIVCYNR
jgi:hypothetical protein